MSVKAINLYSKKGGSDKVYQVQLDEKDGGFVVNFQHGKRGSSLRSDTKTPSPVDLATATKIFDKLVASKKNGSSAYTEGEEGVAYEGTDKQGRTTDVEVCLMNSIERGELEYYFKSDAWGAQEKFNGERRPIIKTGAEVVGVNRLGLSVGLSESISQAARALEGATTATLDSEDMGAIAVCFDVLDLNEQDLRSKPFEQRYRILSELLKASATSIQAIRLAPLAITESDKRALFREVESRDGEGLVFRQLSGAYEGGKASSGGNIIKFKFVETATVIVAAYTVGKRSVEIEVYDKDRCRVSAGKVTIPANAEIPEIGSLIDVQYLYATLAGKLFQPVFDKPRTDLTEQAATILQFKFIPEEQYIPAALG